MTDILNGLEWREKYVYLLFNAYKDVRFNSVNELYEIVGMSREVATRTINSLGGKGYLYWRPRNPDGRYYVLLK